MFNMWVSCIMWMWRITRGYNVDLCSLARTHGARRRSVPLLSTSTAETKLMFLGQRTEAALRFFHPLFLLFPEKLSWPEASRRAKPRLGQGLSPSPHTLSLFSRVPRPYLSYRSAKAARSPVIQQQNAFFWRQIRTGPSIRHGLKVRGDGSNMNSAGGGARWREFSDPRRSAGFFFGGPRCDSSPCSSSSSSLDSGGGEVFFLGLKFVFWVRVKASSCPQHFLRPRACRWNFSQLALPRLYRRLLHTRIFEASVELLSKSWQRRSRSSNQECPSPTAQYGSWRGGGRGGGGRGVEEEEEEEEEGRCYPYRLCINKFYNRRGEEKEKREKEKMSNFLLPPLRRLTCVWLQVGSPLTPWP